MMMNISRTPAPEKWLSPHSLGSTARKALDTRTIVLENSRFSVSTINSELFPELLSWSAIMNRQSTSPRPQIVPLPKSDDGDTILAATLSLSVILDPTTLEFGFDPSCFEGLDDLLVYSPMDAFSEFCWADAVHEDDSDHASSPTPFPLKGAGRTQSVRSPLVKFPSSEESDTDSDESSMFMEDDMIHSPIIGKDVKAVGEFTSYNTLQSLHYNDEATSFMAFEQYFPVSNAKEAVGCFPVPVSPRPSVPKRIAAFCAQLPASLTLMRSPPYP